jgi:hypothetical protein
MWAAADGSQRGQSLAAVNVWIKKRDCQEACCVAALQL